MIKLLFLLIILLIIPIGYFSTLDYFNRDTLLYFSINLGIFFHLALYLRLFFKNKNNNIYLGVILTIFLVSYFIKFYAIIIFIDDENLLSLLTFRSQHKYFYYSNMLLTFKYFSFAFIAIFWVLYILNNYNVKDFQNSRLIHFKSKKTSRFLIFFVSTFSLIVIIFKYLLISNDKVLAFVNITDAFIVPILLTSLVYISILTRNISNVKYSIFLLMFISVIQYVLFSSKLSIILPIIIILFLYIDYGDLVIKTKYIISLLILSLIIYPFLNIYRSLSAFYSDINILNLFSYLINTFNAVYENINYLTVSILSIIGRFTGADSLAILVAEKNTIEYKNFNLIDALLSDKSITQILTYDILKFNFTMGVEASALGQLFFITGNLFSFLLAVVFLVILVYYFTFFILRKNYNIYLNGYYYYYLAVLLVIFNGGLMLKVFIFYILGFLVSMILFNFTINIKKRKKMACNSLKN
jgi:hypothetical protein